MLKTEVRMNGEGYSDPTADISIARVDREMRLRREREEKKRHGTVKTGTGSKGKKVN